MGTNDDLGAGGKVAFGAACALCCALPMLVLAGVLTTGALLLGGIVIGGLAAVVTLTMLVSTRRVRASSNAVRLGLFTVGGAGAFAGLWAAWAGRNGAAALLVVAVAALSAAALLALAATQPAPQ